LQQRIKKYKNIKRTIDIDFKELRKQRKYDKIVPTSIKIK
jgi:hypothetical protein